MTHLLKKSSIITLLIGLGLLFNIAQGINEKNSIIQLTIEDVIGPATDDYVERALETAAQDQVELVIIRMDTPGGLDTAMRGIIKNITNSSVPIATYVAPTGARTSTCLPP